MAIFPEVAVPKDSSISIDSLMRGALASGVNVISIGTIKIRAKRIINVLIEAALPAKSSTPININRAGQNFQRDSQISQERMPTLLSKKTIPSKIKTIGAIIDLFID